MESVHNIWSFLFIFSIVMPIIHVICIRLVTLSNLGEKTVSNPVKNFKLFELIHFATSRIGICPSNFGCKSAISLKSSDWFSDRLSIRNKLRKLVSLSYLSKLLKHKLNAYFLLLTKRTKCEHVFTWNIVPYVIIFIVPK